MKKLGRRKKWNKIRINGIHKKMDKMFKLENTENSYHL